MWTLFTTGPGAPRRSSSHVGTWIIRIWISLHRSWLRRVLGLTSFESLRSTHCKMPFNYLNIESPLTIWILKAHYYVIEYLKLLQTSYSCSTTEICSPEFLEKQCLLDHWTIHTWTFIIIITLPQKGLWHGPWFIKSLGV